MQVSLDGALSHVESRRDDLVGHPHHQLVKNLPLLGRKLDRLFLQPRCRSLIHRGLEAHEVDRLGRNVAAPGQHDANGIGKHLHRGIL